MRNAVRWYGQALRLYPAAYQKQYGPQMKQTLADMLDGAPNRFDRFVILSHATIELPFQALRLHVDNLGGVMRNETSDYIKYSSLVAAVLVAPFFAALIANGLDKVINNHTLYHSWLWSRPYLGLWVLWLPLAALALAVASYIVYAIRPARKRTASWWWRFVDVRRIWPVIVPGLVAAGILFILAFHDSAHCWAQNPVQLARHWQQTVQCTRTGMWGGR